LIASLLREWVSIAMNPIQMQSSCCDPEIRGQKVLIDQEVAKIYGVRPSGSMSGQEQPG